MNSGATPTCCASFAAQAAGRSIPRVARFRLDEPARWAPGGL